mmetsp:Transcript_13316/g.30990  ORF Transcript_13316/g.30990 Transcript_13316/m.30990 type:complete len:164 (-) Transcript_13316:34-525(-)
MMMMMQTTTLWLRKSPEHNQRNLHKNGCSEWMICNVSLSSPTEVHPPLAMSAKSLWSDPRPLRRFLGFSPFAHCWTGSHCSFRMGSITRAEGEWGTDLRDLSERFFLFCWWKLPSLIHTQTPRQLEYQKKQYYPNNDILQRRHKKQQNRSNKIRIEVILYRLP